MENCYFCGSKTKSYKRYKISKILCANGCFEEQIENNGLEYHSEYKLRIKGLVWCSFKAMSDSETWGSHLFQTRQVLKKLGKNN